MRCEGRYFDGDTGLRLDVGVEIDADRGNLCLQHPGLPGGVLIWPFPTLRRLQDEARSFQMTLSQSVADAPDSSLIDLPRLVIRNRAMVSELKKLAPNLDKRDRKPGVAWKITRRLSYATGALALMLFVILPAMADTLARLLPVQREVAWGKVVVAQVEQFLGTSDIGALVCDDPAGKAALDRMVARVSEGTGLSYELNVQVFDHPMLNAFAAPGGQVILMRGLIEQADSPEEVAAVLAHEIGHVEHRDATRNSLRAAGSAGLLAMVLGDFAGGSVAVVVAESILGASYTRDAEAKADAFAHDMLVAAQVPVEDMAGFFDKIGAMDGGIDLPEYLSSHPATDARAAAARAVAEGQSETRAVLTDAEWKALRNICG